MIESAAWRSERILPLSRLGASVVAKEAKLEWRGLRPKSVANWRARRSTRAGPKRRTDDDGTRTIALANADRRRKGWRPRPPPSSALPRLEFLRESSPPSVWASHTRAEADELLRFRARLDPLRHRLGRRDWRVPARRGAGALHDTGGGGRGEPISGGDLSNQAPGGGAATPRASSSQTCWRHDPTGDSWRVSAALKARLPTEDAALVSALRRVGRFCCAGSPAGRRSRC
jgi:hypothetical protein